MVFEVVKRLAPWLNITFIAFIGGNVLFIVPCVMETKKELIDAKVTPLVKKAIDTKEKKKAKILAFKEEDFGCFTSNNN